MNYQFESKKPYHSDAWCKEALAHAEKLSAEYAKLSTQLLTAPNGEDALRATVSLVTVIPEIVRIKAEMPTIVHVLSQGIPNVRIFVNEEELKYIKQWSDAWVTSEVSDVPKAEDTKETSQSAEEGASRIR